MRRARATRVPCPHQRLGFESLEARELLAADVGFDWWSETWAEPSVNDWSWSFDDSWTDDASWDSTDWTSEDSGGTWSEDVWSEDAWSEDAWSEDVWSEDAWSAPWGDDATSWTNDIAGIPAGGDGGVGGVGVIDVVASQPEPGSVEDITFPVADGRLDGTVAAPGDSTTEADPGLPSDTPFDGGATTDQPGAPAQPEPPRVVGFDDAVEQPVIIECFFDSPANFEETVLGTLVDEDMPAATIVAIEPEAGETWTIDTMPVDEGDAEALVGRDGSGAEASDLESAGSEGTEPVAVTTVVVVPRPAVIPPTVAASGVVPPAVPVSVGRSRTWGGFFFQALGRSPDAMAVATPAPGQPISGRPRLRLLFRPLG